MVLVSANRTACALMAMFLIDGYYAASKLYSSSDPKRFQWDNTKFTRTFVFGGSATVLRWENNVVSNSCWHAYLFIDFFLRQRSSQNVCPTFNAQIETAQAHRLRNSRLATPRTVSSCAPKCNGLRLFAGNYNAPHQRGVDVPSIFPT